MKEMILKIKKAIFKKRYSWIDDFFHYSVGVLIGLWCDNSDKTFTKIVVVICIVSFFISMLDERNV